MYKIPLTNSPNQTFSCSIPLNGKNVRFEFNLWYNYQAEYWMLSLYDYASEKLLFSNLPLLASNGKFSNMFYQLEYMMIGICIMVPTIEDVKSQADDTNLGTSYIMIWGDNDG